MSLLRQFLHRMVANPKVYNQIQAILGFEQTRRHLRSYLAQTSRKVMLDVGAGTGHYRSLVSETARYLWLDMDIEKLREFRQRQNLSSDLVLLGDATRIGLRDHSVDFALCIAVSHHLSDQQLASLFSELARVVRENVIFLDALDCPKSLTSRLLWRYDRGSSPRTLATLLAAIEAYLEIEQLEQYKIHHHYLLCLAHPKNLM